MGHKLLKFLLSGVVVLAAIGIVASKYWYYITNPWTRDGQVRANVIQVATRVDGPIVNLPIKNNQWVRALRGAEHALFSAWMRYNSSQ